MNKFIKVISKEAFKRLTKLNEDCVKAMVLPDTFNYRRRRPRQELSRSRLGNSTNGHRQNVGSEFITGFTQTGGYETGNIY